MSFNPFIPFPEKLRNKLDKPVEYKLCSVREVNHYDIETTRVENRTLVPSAVYIPSAFAYLDPNTSEAHTIQFVIGQKQQLTQGGESITVPVIGNITFNRAQRGFMKLDPKNPQHQILYTVLELHPMNKANGGEVFEKIDVDKQIQEIERREKEDYAATQKVFGIKDAELDYYVNGFLINFGMPLAEVPANHKRMKLLSVAKNNPEDFLSRLKDQYFEMYSNISQLQSIGELIYDETKQYWTTKNRTEKLCDKQPGQNAVDSLSDFFKTTKQGEKSYELLVEILKSAKK